jgi:NADH:ubiquinone oxidoreductase subunit F (NADH-binding)
VIAPGALPRLLTGATGRPLSLDQHERLFAGAGPSRPLVEELEAAGLTGRGGAAFPTFRKVRLIREQRGHHKWVVVNAMEGEPAAHKDQTLLAANPHLVLDGAELLASAVGARSIAVCVSREAYASVNHLKHAIHERQRRSQRGPQIELHTPPHRYVAGEESALVHWLDDNESLPQYRPERPHILRLGRGPVLLDNAETCANVGLIGRYGAEWYRSVGTAGHPGSTLVSVSGAVDRPAVVEVATGTAIRSILRTAGADEAPQALLLGGYGGMWVGPELLDAPYANDALGPRGASVGAGVMVVLARSGCGIAETHRIVRWMANESARQCGPCAFGLPALADDLAHLVRPSRDSAEAHARLVERCAVIEGRGACRHPDGVVRLVRSALTVFAADLADHLRGAPCGGARESRHYATVPHLEREEELVWE